LTLLEGLFGLLYYLPIWTFPNYPSLNSFDTSNKYGLAVIITFMIISW